VRWSTEFLFGRVAAALVRYLAVAHFGRGRGEFVAGSVPPHWQEAVGMALAQRRFELDELWGARGEPGSRFASGLLSLFIGSAQEVLIRLYPEVSDVFALGAPCPGFGDEDDSLKDKRKDKR
jgi:hypothetical protein